MIDWGSYEIKQDGDNFIVFDIFNGTQHKFDTLEECGEFITKELVYTFNTYSG